MKSLMRRQVSQKIEKIQELRAHVKGIPSWINYLRKALGMSSSQLAERMGIAKSSLHQIERQEALDKISVQSLKKAAEAMNCELVYALVPRIPLEEIIEEQAIKKAKKIIEQSSIQMEYEDQAVMEKEVQEQFKELVESFKESRKLWEQD